MSDQKHKTIGILGCGWLGLPLAKNLVELGYKVHGSTTQATKLKAIKQTGAKAFIVQCEENSCVGLVDFLTQVDYLIIALPPGIRANPNRRFDLIVDQIQQEVVRQGIIRVIFISSTAVYGATSGIINEETPTAAVSISGKQLILCEHLLLKNPAFATSIIRFGGLIGPNRHPIFSLAKRTKIDNPEGKINFIHLADCLALICRAIASFQGGSIYNGVSPYHPNRKAYYTKMALLAGIKLPPFSNEKGVDRIISAEKAEKELGLSFLVENLLTLN